MTSHKRAISITYYSIAINVLMAVVKFVVGILGNSYAMIADAIESTADIFTSIIIFLGLRFSNKPPDKNHPYGHGKAEPLVTIIVVLFLLMSSVIIFYQSIIHIRTPHQSPKPYTLIVLGVIILTKELFYRIISRRGKEMHSSSLIAEAWHHRADAITSLVAFGGISVALILGKGYESADDWAALIAAFIILFNCYRIFRPALGEIMDEHLYDDLVNEIKIESLEVPGVLDTEKCHIRKTGIRYFVDLHIVVKYSISVQEGHRIAHDLKEHLMTKMPQLLDVLIHVEPDVL